MIKFLSELFPRPLVLLVRDLWYWGATLLCIIRRQHKVEIYIGDLVKKGFRGVPLHQCPRCSQIVVRPELAKRIGGKL